MRETVKVSLGEDEYDALERLADTELRPVHLQAQRLIIDALKRRRMLDSHVASRRQSEPIRAEVVSA